MSPMNLRRSGRSMKGCFRLSTKSMRKRADDSASTPGLRFQINRGLEASVHIEGHGFVLMHDLPTLAVELLQAEADTEPDGGTFAALFLAGHVSEAVTEADALVGVDFQV